MNIGKYRFICTLTLGDIFGQVIIWLGVIFASLAAALSLMSNPILSVAAVGLIVVTSLPFLLFAFVTTLVNHIEVMPLTEEQIRRENAKISGMRKTMTSTSQLGA
jgi:succinate-acetate transporter protein